MESGLTLYLAPGAIIKGTGKVSDYPRGELGTQQIYLLACQDVRIRGRGVIDGQGRRGVRDLPESSMATN